MTASFLVPSIWIAGAAALAVCVFLGAELLFRIRYRDVLRTRIYPRVYVPDEDLGYRYRPNTEGEICIPGIHRRFRINNKGFNGRDFVHEKPAETYRIAVIGSSNTTGIWMDGQGKNFCEMLEELLQVSGHRVEVMNFGIDGRYRAVHELRLLDTDVVEYEPDLVLMDVDLPFVCGPFRRDVYKSYVVIYNSETEFSKKWCEAVIDNIVKRRFWIGLYRMSYVARAAARYYMNNYNTVLSAHLRVFVENRIQAPDVVLLPYSLKKSVQALQAARDKLAKQGGELIIFQFFASPYHRQVTGKYGLSYIELDVPAVPQFVHDHDGHYRHQGHVEVARQLFGQLRNRGIFEAGEKERVQVAL